METQNRKQIEALNEHNAYLDSKLVDIASAVDTIAVRTDPKVTVEAFGQHTAALMQEVVQDSLNALNVQITRQHTDALAHVEEKLAFLHSDRGPAIELRDDLKQCCCDLDSKLAVIASAVDTLAERYDPKVSGEAFEQRIAALVQFFDDKLATLLADRGHTGGAKPKGSIDAVGDFVSFQLQEARESFQLASKLQQDGLDRFLKQMDSHLAGVGCTHDLVKCSIKQSQDFHAEYRDSGQAQLLQLQTKLQNHIEAYSDFLENEKLLLGKAVELLVDICYKIDGGVASFESDVNDRSLQFGPQGRFQESDHETQSSFGRGRGRP